MPRRARIFQQRLTAGAVLVVAAVSAVALLKWAPEWLAQVGLHGKAHAEDVARTRTAVLAAAAGLIAVVGAVFTGLSYRLSRAGQITERYTRAVDQLGSAELDVRLGGIYALERIARDSADDHPQVMEILAADVREHARGQLDTPAHATDDAAKDQEQRGALPAEVAGRAGPAVHDAPPLPTDVQAVLSVLGRRVVVHDRPRAASISAAPTSGPRSSITPTCRARFSPAATCPVPADS